MGTSTLVSGPVVEPVTVAEAKSHMRIDFADDDTLIGVLVTAAREYVEAELNRDLVERTWDYTFDDLCGDVVLPHNPVQSVTSVTYSDGDGQSQTVATSVYGTSLSTPARVWLKNSQSWPTVYNQRDSVTVRYVTGYAGTADSPVDRTAIPEAIRVAILMATADLYEHREAQTTSRSVGVEVLQANLTVARLLNPYRVIWL